MHAAYAYICILLGRFCIGWASILILALALGYVEPKAQNLNFIGYISLEVGRRGVVILARSFGV